MSKELSFFRLMGCVTFIIAIAAIIGLIIKTVNDFGANVNGWISTANILNILAVTTLGCGLGSLFFSHADNL